MAGHARYTAVLDACVLHPMVMCDALMSLAVHRLFAAKWSERIDHEWIRSLYLSPYEAIAALKGMRARWRRPETTPEDFAEAFDRGGLPGTAQRLREAAELI